MEAAKVTPMIQQYLQIKERYRDAILFYRLGDFYEMFFEDAETAARVLDIALTSRNKNESAAIPLCGVPYHAAEPYIQKLLDAGHKVAVCEQVEDPKSARGVVRREVVRVITPGTVTAAEALDARGNNFLLAVGREEDCFGLAVTDITTGEFRCTQLGERQSLVDEIGRIHPSEILAAKGDGTTAKLLQREFPTIQLTFVPEGFFSERARAALASTAEPAPGWHQGVRAASAILAYLEANTAASVPVLRILEPYEASGYLVLDAATRTNLELTESFRGERHGSLLAVLDRTETPMGARNLRQWLLYPLLEEKAIRERQEGVQALVDNYSLRQDLRRALRKIQDLERLSARLVAGSASPKDLGAVKETLVGVAELRGNLGEASSSLLRGLGGQMAELPQAIDLIDRAIVENPPLSLKEGGYIRGGFDRELDEIRSARTHARDWIAAFEAGERRRTGIQSLKVRYNRVFGYYIEVSKSNLKFAPETYIRKQTLVNGERFITPDLKEYEAKVLNSESLMEKLESTLLARVRSELAALYPELKATSIAVAAVDALLSLAEVAESCHYVRPEVNDSLQISIREGRHPVVEHALGRGAFVPNDCTLDADQNQILILTGPNMAGKSTYMRQIALTVILGQMGSFVPATTARIGMVDRLFTRIGATDFLARGESTFMVEMRETAHILRYASQRSLILLDEVGRGTSTFDGISIAWAVAEWLHDHAGKPRTLFATHYHELADLAQTRERVKNHNFAVKEWQGEIIFLRNLLEGAASHSYGIHVARLAGLPPPVIHRAKEILQQLEEGQGRENGFGALAQSGDDRPRQLALFGSLGLKLCETLRKIDVSHMTPLEALNLLSKLSQEAQKTE